MITLKKADIGGEIISILTKGMYSDPKDALREYVQNSVDAKAKQIDIKVRHNNIVVQDDGEGMTYTTMRNAIRLGVSDKNPKNHVGFMGIGIYSSFHICENLVIYSRIKNRNPNKISFDFLKMREELEGQRESRFKNKNLESNIIALQKLLENNIDIEVLDIEDFSKIGTRVELVGLESDFFRSLSKFSEVAEYLEKVLPLPFDTKFKWGTRVTEKIKEECKKNNVDFEIVNVKLQVNEDVKNLYKPFKDEDFDTAALPPKFIELKNDNEFFGIAWGCLNEKKVAIKNDEVRGFLIKKQGFTIGSRDDLLLDYFKRPIFFNRSVGEVIVLHPKLLPNASRSAFEPSPLRLSFYACLGNFAETYNAYANKHQEESKASEKLDYAIEFYKKCNAQFNYFKNDNEKLLINLFELKAIDKDIERRYNAGRFENIKKIQEYHTVNKLINELANQIREIIDSQQKRKTNKRKAEITIFNENKSLRKITDKSQHEIIKDLLEVISSFDIEMNNDVESIFRLIDEQFIQPSRSKSDYEETLRKLKQDIEELLEE